MHAGLEEFFKGGFGFAPYEGDTFCICLDEGFVDSIYETGEPRCLGYSEYMHVLFAKRDGKNMPYQKINTSYIFPIFTEPEESGNIYIIAPIHSQGTVIGYGVFKLTGTRITDPTSGYRMVDDKLIKYFAFNYPSDYPEPESAVSILAKGWKITEIPVEMRARQAGKSSINFKKSIYYMIKVSIAIVLANIR